MPESVIPFRVDNVGINLNGSLTIRSKEEIDMLKFALAHWEYFKTKKKAQDRIKELENRIFYLSECKDSEIYNK